MSLFEAFCVLAVIVIFAAITGLCRFWFEWAWWASLLTATVLIVIMVLAAFFWILSKIDIG